MGFYDRDYYRDESNGLWASVTGHGTTWTLIAVTVGVFVAQVVTRQQGGPWPDLVSQWFGFDVLDVRHGQVWRLVTAHFVNWPGGLIGVAFAMIGLWFFGTAVEGIYGPREFLAFYLASGVAITLAELLAGLGGVPGPHQYLGSGGVVVAVLVLYACHFPHNRILVMFIIPVPAWLLVALIVGIALMNSLGDGGPVPTLTAAAFAFLYFRAQVRITNLLPNLSGWSAGRRRRLRVFNERDEAEQPVGAASTRGAKTASSSRPGRGVDEQLEAKLDHVLEKVSQYGRDSLTPEERDILLRASEIYKRRREG
jgi:membrane associated rhomboid family serine protease